LQRCRDFEAEGADIIFLEAPESEDEMRRFCAAMKKPCLANLVPGGKTPILPTAELGKIGYRLALYPVMTLSVAISAMQASLNALAAPGTPAPPAVSFTELQKIVGFPQYWDAETRYTSS
jgi:2-methylisocitrate lyase-like PEP mutase family enzyme